MFFELIMGCKGTSTKVAHIRFLPAVDAHVNSQMRHLGGSVRTHPALERPLASMCPNVCSQMAGLVTFIRAVGATVNCEFLGVSSDSTLSSPVCAAHHL